MPVFPVPTRPYTSKQGFLIHRTPCVKNLSVALLHQLTNGRVSSPPPMLQSNTERETESYTQSDILYWGA